MGYARSVHSAKPDSGDFTGFSKDIRSIVDAAVSILEGNDYLVEELICSEPKSEYIRRMCDKSLLGSLAYVIRSNSAYTSTCCEVLRGEMDFGEAESYFPEHK